MMMSSMMVTLFFVSRLRMIARFLAVVNCLYGAGERNFGAFYNKATPSAASAQGKLCQPLLRSGQGFDACSSFSHKSFASQNLCGSPKIIPQNSLTRLLREPYDSLRRVVELNNPSVLLSASHLPLHRGGYNKESFPKLFPRAKPRFCAAGLNLCHTWRLLFLE